MLNLSNWFTLALISAFFLGMNVVLIKAITTRGLSPVLTTAYVFTLAGVLLWVFAISTQKIIFPTNSLVILLLILACIASAVGSLTSFTAFKHASNPGYARAVSSVSVLIAFLVSFLVFKSKFDILGLIGVLLILGGVILLSRVV